MKKLIFFFVFFFYSLERIKPQEKKKKENNIFKIGMRESKKVAIFYSLLILLMFIAVIQDLNLDTWLLILLSITILFIILLFFIHIYEGTRKELIRWYKNTNGKSKINEYQFDIDTRIVKVVNNRLSEVGEATLESQFEEFIYGYKSPS